MPSESAKRAGELNRRRKAEKDRQWNAKILSESRPIDEDIRLTNVGELKLRLYRFPSFSEANIWDIREQSLNDVVTYNLYVNTMESMHIIAPGYKQLPIPSNTLKDLIDKISKYSVKLDFDNQSTMGLDGTVYGIAVYYSVFSKTYIEWWEDLHPELKGLSDLTKNAIKAFEQVNTNSDKS